MMITSTYLHAIHCTEEEMPLYSIIHLVLRHLVKVFYRLNTVHVSSHIYSSYWCLWLHSFSSITENTFYSLSEAASKAKQGRLKTLKYSLTLLCYCVYTVRH